MDLLIIWHPKLIAHWSKKPSISQNTFNLALTYTRKPTFNLLFFIVLSALLIDMRF